MSDLPVVIDSADKPAQTWAAFGDTSWAGASQGREMEDWNPSVGSADADLLPEIDDLRLRSRDADRKFPVAHSALEAIVTNVVGPGLLCIPDVDYEALGKDKAWGIKTNKLLKRRARAFLRSASIDATGIDNFNGLTSLVYRSVKTSGGIIALAVYSPDGLSGYGTKIHLVEIDRVSAAPGEQNGPNYRDGIGFDEYGKAEFYDIQNAHPGDSLIGYDPEAFTWTRVPAETSWGRKRVLHIFDKERVDVSKGVSQLARVLPRLHTFDKLTQSTLQKEFSASLVALILKTNMNWEQVQKLFSSPEEYLKFRKANQPKLGTGSVLTVSPGEDVEAFSGARPGSDYDAFSVNIMREIAAGMKVPYELAMRAFAGMNYSNARVMLSEAWRDFGTDRGWLINRWCDPVYKLWFEEDVDRGGIPDCDPDELFTVPGMFEAWTRCKWIGTGRGFIDPKKEGEAQSIRLANGTSNLMIECAEQGLDWEEVLEQRAYERDRYREAGMKYPGDEPPPAHALIGHNRPPADDDDPDAADRREMMV